MTKNTGKNKSTINLSDVDQKLAAAQAEVTRLQQVAVEHRNAEALAVKAKIDALPAHFGVADHAAVIALIRKSSRPTGGARKGRTVVTPEIEANVLSLVREGKMTGAEISAKLGISVPTIQKLKAKAGLVNTRK